VAADTRAVKHRCAHADQRTFADRAAVDDGMVADGATGANRDGEAEVIVDHHAFLDIGALPKHDWFVVTPQDRSEPDATIEADAAIADHGRRRRHPITIGCGSCRLDPPKSVKWHFRPPACPAPPRQRLHPDSLTAS